VTRYGTGVGAGGFASWGRAHTRALYIHECSRGTLYRIYGNGEAQTIGKAFPPAASAFCIRG
jgi:lipoprotein-anchoring transpeptidase ErfK/SrfK